MNMARYEQETIISFNEEEKRPLVFTPTTRYCVRSWQHWRGTDRRIAGSSKRPAADGQLTTPFQNHG